MVIVCMFISLVGCLGEMISMVAGASIQINSNTGLISGIPVHLYSCSRSMTELFSHCAGICKAGSDVRDSRFFNLIQESPMHATVSFDRNLPLVGLNTKGQRTFFDASLDPSIPPMYASPMEIMLQSLGACSMMDVIAILGKMRKEVVTLDARIEAERAEEHPKVFTSIHISYKLRSPDCSKAELDKAVGLSMEKYCSVSAMMRAAGCAVTWDTELVAE
jgi:putative redox protein